MKKILDFLLQLIINRIFVIALVSKRNILINVFLGLSDMISAHMTTCTASEGSMKQSALDIWKSRQIHFYFDEVIQKLLTIISYQCQRFHSWMRSHGSSKHVTFAIDYVHDAPWNP